MFSVGEFLDRARQRGGIKSDYALAARIGVTRSAISNYRSGKNAPDGRTIMALCALSGDDPEHVAACVQAMRAANDDEAALWERIAARLKQTGAASLVFTLACIAILLASMYGGPVLADDGGSAYYVELVVAARLLWRAAHWFKRIAHCRTASRQAVIRGLQTQVS